MFNHCSLHSSWSADSQDFDDHEDAEVQDIHLQELPSKRLLNGRCLPLCPWGPWSSEGHRRKFLSSLSLFRSTFMNFTSPRRPPQRIKITIKLCLARTTKSVSPSHPSRKLQIWRLMHIRSRTLRHLWLSNWRQIWSVFLFLFFSTSTCILSLAIAHVSLSLLPVIPDATTYSVLLLAPVPHGSRHLHALWEPSTGHLGRCLELFQWIWLEWV
jgi:hypothetical protein